MQLFALLRLPGMIWRQGIESPERAVLVIHLDYMAQSSSVGFRVDRLRQAQALGDGKRVAAQVAGQRPQRASGVTEFGSWLIQPPVGVVATTGKGDARRRQDTGLQTSQRFGGRVIYVHVQRGQRDHICRAASESIPVGAVRRQSTRPSRGDWLPAGVRGHGPADRDDPAGCDARVRAAGCRLR